VYCSVRVDWCQLAAVEFERATGIKTIAPCGGTGYEIGSMSLIKGGATPRTRGNGTIGR
jgi:hypothetical protein